MKAPNKIYVPILPRIENSIISEHCVGTAWDNKEHITIPDIEEYIRKDALLEWAKDLKHIYEIPVNNHQAGKFCRAKAKAFQMIIEKIESL